MNFEEFLKKDSDLLALVGALKSNSFLESKFKIFITKELFSRYKIDDNLSRDDILILAEDISVPYPEDDMIQLVESMGILEPVSEFTYKITGKINLSNFFHDASQYNLRADANDYMQLWERLDNEIVRTYLDINDCIRSIRNTQKLSFQLINNSVEEKLKGIPPFIDCSGYNNHIFMNRNPGLQTTADTFRLLLITYLYGFKPHKEIKDLIKITHNSIRNFQEENSGWNCGGFYPGDEIPGSDYPLVDSTAVSIHSLTLLWLTIKNSFPEELNNYSSGLIESILEGTKFLMRMQKDDGSWSMYRYENEEYMIETSFHSCKLAIEALSLLKQTNILESSHSAAISSTIDRYINFISITMRLKNEMFFWQELKWIKEDTPENIIIPTLNVIDSLLYYSKLSKANQNKVSYILKGGVNYIIFYLLKYNNENRQTEMIIPTKKGIRTINCNFNLPVRTRSISILLDYSTQNPSLLNFNLYNEIKKEILSIMGTQVHGHWEHPLDARPSIPFTYCYYEVLLKYVAFQMENIKNA